VPDLAAAAIERCRPKADVVAAAAKVREDEGAPAVRGAYNVADYASGADDAAILAGNDDGPGPWNRSWPIRPGRTRVARRELLGHGVRTRVLEVHKHRPLVGRRDDARHFLPPWPRQEPPVAGSAQYTTAKEEMFHRTNIPEAPWYIGQGNDKKRARLNCIDHFLSLMPYEPVPHEEIMLPDRVYNAEYERELLPPELYVPSKY
jgi:hypothetical protein